MYWRCGEGTGRGSHLACGGNITLRMAVAQLVEVLRYTPEGRGFDFRRCHWNFFIDVILLGLTQPLAEVSTRNISWEIKAADALGRHNLTSLTCRLSRNQGASISWKPLGLQYACRGIDLPFYLQTTHYFSTCDPRTSPQWRIAPFAINWLETHDIDQELKILCTEFHSLLSLLCHTFYSVFACCFLFPFLVRMSASRLSSLFILSISLFSVCCFSYLFFSLRCSVSSFPSCAPFLYPLFSVRSVLFHTLSLHILSSLLSSIRCRSLTNSARAVQDTSMNYVARTELTSAVLKARSHTAYWVR